MKNVFFSLMGIAFLSSEASAQSESQTRKSDRVITEKTWTNATPQAVAAIDDLYMYTNKITGSNTGNFRFTNFGFSIPPDARIDSLKCAITRFQKGKDILYDADAGFTKKCEYTTGSCLFRRLKSGEKWTTVKSLVTFTDYEFGKNLSGTLTTQWVAADINDENFGFNLLASTVKGTSSANPYIDQVEITVFYTPVRTARLATSNQAFGTAPTPTFTAKTLGGFNEERVQTFGHTIGGGYYVAGATNSKDGDVTGLLGGTDIWFTKLDANLAIKWRLCIGTRNSEEGAIVRETTSGDFIVAGNTVDAKGNRNILLARVSSSGTLLWQKILGGTGDDRVASIELLDEQYFLLSSETNSNNGDVAGNHGGYDAWIVKINSSNGNPLWKRTVGGSGNEYTRTMQKANDGGVILCAMTYSTELPGFKGISDALIAKIQPDGTIGWTILLGNSSSDQEMIIRNRPAGDFIFAISPTQNDGDFSGPDLKGKIWVQQISAGGAPGWKSNYAGNVLYDMQVTPDNRIVLAGGIDPDASTAPYGGILAINLAADGTVLWQKAYGGSKTDFPWAIRSASDGGYIIMGVTNSFDGDVLNSHASATNPTSDTWMIKLDAQGDMIWNRAFGGSDEDWYCDCGSSLRSFWATDPISMRYPANFFNASLLEDNSGNYYFATTTKSRDGDVQGLHYNNRSGLRPDIWFVKISPASASASRVSTTIVQPGLLNHFQHSLSPNPVKHSTTISFKAIESASAAIEIFNMQGVKIKTQILGNTVKGQLYRYQVNLGTLSSGTYLYRLINGRSTNKGTMIKGE